MKIEDSGAKPKSTAGRRAVPLDTGGVEALAKAFADKPYIEVDGENRPRLLGPDTVFKTKGKATSQGRRYQAELEKTGHKLRVTAIEVKNDKGETQGFKWRLYKPLTESQEEAEAA